MVSAGSTSAQPTMNCPHDDQDNICIIFDYDIFCCDNCKIPDYQGELAVHFVLHNCSAASGISGYEFCICNPDGSPFVPPPNVAVVSYDYVGQAINALSEPCFAVGLGSAIPNDGFCTLLFTMNLVVLSEECFCFGVSPLVGEPLTPPPSIPDEMVYVLGNSPGVLIPMDPCTGLEYNSCEMACINCAFCPPGPPIEIQRDSWGIIKSLYR
jgi:hypothetical protein